MHWVYNTNCSETKFI